MAKDALVGNAADRKQLDEARRQEKAGEVKKDERFKRLMQSADFRGWVWDFLTRTRVFNSVYEQNARIYYNSGQQDIGHEVLGEVARLTPELYLTMISENSNA